MNAHAVKITLLNLLYRTFDAYVNNQYKAACRKGCALCCTQHVTLTTVEAYRISRHLKQFSMKVDLTAHGYFFRPKHTINDIAHACLNRQQPPEESPDRLLKPCPLLDHDLCTIYDNRPFICRAFLSLHSCHFEGQAEVSSGLASVIGTCQQIIEHMDVGGYFGNLTDILSILEEGDNTGRYVRAESNSKIDLPINRPLPGFLVPPEDLGEVNAFLSDLLAKPVDGMTYLQVLNRIHPIPIKTFK